MARLLNAFASLTPGRAYLASGGHLLAAIMDNVEINKLETISLDMSLATLQKLSLRLGVVIILKADHLRV